MALLTKQNNTMRLQTCMYMLVIVTAETYRHTQQFCHICIPYSTGAVCEFRSAAFILEGTEFVVMQSCPFFGGAIVIVTKDVSEARRLLE